MPDPDSGGNGGGAAGAAATNIMNLRPPKQLCFNIHKTGMAESWKGWREEFQLYITLAMGNQSEAQKIALLQYLISDKKVAQ